jgi:uncharacterized protein (TIGR00375 family)
MSLQKTDLTHGNVSGSSGPVFPVRTEQSFFADFHIHSAYSRATSRDMRPETIARAAAAKGLALVGTGDFTHPEWLGELREALEPAEPGLYMLKGRPDSPRFMLTAEISNIFTQGGRGRRIHTVVFAPDFEVAEDIQNRLAAIGNIHSDGRPIFGFPVKELVRLCLEASPDCFIIPAHVWTPWFALFGAKSGFDSLEECFEEQSCHIHALETGLSSDPQMNWRISALDRYALVSNSDAHSPSKLAREANVFSCEMNYHSVCAAIRGEIPGFDGTIEFFPEEGKYHYDGHRACNICLKPSETRRHDGLCPVCGRPLTVGVMHRVEELADRPEGFVPSSARPCLHVIPLEEIVREVYGIKTVTKRVRKTCETLVEHFGSELGLLLHVPEDELREGLTDEMFRAITAARRGDVRIFPGHDGVYGRVSINAEGVEMERACGKTGTERERKVHRQKKLFG